MGLAAQGFVNDGGLQLADQGGQKDDHRHPTRDPGQDQQGLHAPLTQVAQAHHRGKRQARHEGCHRRTVKPNLARVPSVDVKTSIGMR